MMDSKVLRQFVQAATDQLEGDWLMVGGTVLPLVGIDYRTTVDIDLVRISKKKAANTQALELMKVAESMGLPVESINQAAEFFVEKIEGYQKELILFREGKKGRIYRPTFLLYLQLKTGRLSETDCEDLIQYYRYCKRAKDPLQPDRIQKWLKGRVSKESDRVKLERFSRLESTVLE